MNDASREDPKAEDGAAANPNPPAGELLTNHDRALVMPPMYGLAFALLAGLVVWGSLELIMPVFQLPEALRASSGNVPEAELTLIRDTKKLNKDRNAILSLVLLATTVALVLTVAEQIHRRAGVRAVWGGVVAGLVAGIIAVGAGNVAIGLNDGLDLEGQRLGKTILVQVAMLGVMGMGIGLAIGLPMFRPRLLGTCIAGCLIGGILAALIFPVTASTCMPHMNTDHLVPEKGVGRLLWAGMAAGLIGLTATGLGKEKKKRRAETG